MKSWQGARDTGRIANHDAVEISHHNAVRQRLTIDP
jgi:hypothetical protein